MTIDLFQYATLLDGMMIMILTVKGSLQELVVLLTYILMAMFFYSTVVTFAEIAIESGRGIPDVPIGRFDLPDKFMVNTMLIYKYKVM